MDTKSDIITDTDVTAGSPPDASARYLDINSTATKLVWLPALLVTAAITVLMVVLIATPQATLQPKGHSETLNFIRVNQQEVAKIREFKAKKPKPAKPPATPPMDITVADQSMHIQKIPVKLALLPPTAKGNIGIHTGTGPGTGFQIGNFQEAEYLPLVKIAPVYPPHALTRGLEGYCMVEYDVTVKGTTKDVRLVQNECSHPIFAHPSIMAAKKFRYQPRVIDGKTIEVHGIKNRFDYKIRKKQW